MEATHCQWIITFGRVQIQKKIHRYDIKVFSLSNWIIAYIWFCRIFIQVVCLSPNIWVVRVSINNWLIHFIKPYGWMVWFRKLSSERKRFQKSWHIYANLNLMTSYIMIRPKPSKQFLLFSIIPQKYWTNIMPEMILTVQNGVLEHVEANLIIVVEDESHHLVPVFHTSIQHLGYSFFSILFYQWVYMIQIFILFLVLHYYKLYITLKPLAILMRLMSSLETPMLFCADL